jgi:hypothetical protein
VELCWLSPKIAANSTYLFLCSCSQYIRIWHVQGRFLFSESNVNFLYVVDAAISLILWCVNVFLYRKREMSSQTARRFRRYDNRFNLAPLILTSRLHLTSHFWRIRALLFIVVHNRRNKNSMCGCFAVYCENVFYYIYTPLIQRISTVFETFVRRTKQIFIPVLIQQHVSTWQAIIGLTKNSSMFVVNLMMACQVETCCWSNTGLNICVCIDGDSYYAKHIGDETSYKKVGWFVTGCRCSTQKSISAKRRRSLKSPTPTVLYQHNVVTVTSLIILILYHIGSPPLA